MQSTIITHSKLLHVVNLLVGYQQSPICKIPDIAVNEGEVVSLVGVSGTGKTTLLKVLAGELSPISGEIFIEAKNLNDAQRRKLVSRTVQSFPLLHWLTVEQNLKLAARIRKSSPNIGEILRRFKADHLVNRYPQSLSGGERCRASLAQAVVSTPKVLLLDEPFNGLDTVTKKAVSKELFRFASEVGCAAILVTHDLHDAIDHGSQVFVLSGKGIATVKGKVQSRDPEAMQKLSSFLEHE